MPDVAESAGDRGTLGALDLARLLASTDGTPAWQWFGGHAFGVVGDLEPLRQLFEVEGCTVTISRTDRSGRVQVAARQVTLYRDLSSRRVLERWQNPYTGQTLQVPHAHQPRIGTTLAETGPGVPWLGAGDRVSVFLDDHRTRHFPLAPAAADATSPRRESSSAQLIARRSTLQDAREPAVGYTGAWQLLTDWPDWLAMGSMAGYFFQRVFLRKSAQRDELPAELRQEILQRFPSGLDAPQA